MHMKFDVVVGNPPFNKPKESQTDHSEKLWPIFTQLAFELSRSHVCWIIPSAWFAPTRTFKRKFRGYWRLWDLLDDMEAVAEAKYASSLADGRYSAFDGVGTTAAWFVADVNGTDGLRFTDGRPTHLGFLPHNMERPGVRELVERYLTGRHDTNNVGSMFKHDQKDRPHLRVALPMTRLVNAPERVQILQAHETNEMPPGPAFFLYYHVNTQEEAELLRDTFWNARSIINTHARYCGWLNNTAVDLLAWPPREEE